MAFSSIGGSEYAIGAKVKSDTGAKIAGNDDFLKASIQTEHGWSDSDATACEHNLYLMVDFWALGDF